MNPNNQPFAKHKIYLVIHKIVWLLRAILVLDQHYLTKTNFANSQISTKHIATASLIIMSLSTHFLLLGRRFPTSKSFFILVLWLWSTTAPTHTVAASSDSVTTKTSTSTLTATKNEIQYGVDVSFPVHHSTVSTNYAWLPHNSMVDGGNGSNNIIMIPNEYKDMPIQPLGDRQSFYQDFLQGCKNYYGKKHGHLCESTERDRIEMSLRQPASMQNYTDMGFKKIRAPPSLWSLLNDFWEKNKHNQKKEVWPKGNTYTNHWAAPTFMVSIEDSGLRGGGKTLKQSIWDAARDTIQEWTGQELTPASMYGIRVYTGGALLAPHVDRLPLVSSAIVNVAQDVDEPWPLEVIGRDGIAYNVTMEPGDMVLYESHSCLHARPFPMKGRYFANIFIHFEPVGHSLRHNYQYDDVDVHKKYSTSISRRQVGHEAEQSGLPPYIMDGSEEAKRWRRSHPNDQPSSRVSSFTTGSTSAHMAAQDGDIETLMKIVDKRGHLVNAKDENGWTPLHEGARGGHVDVIELLVSRGAEMNERTNHGSGSSALYIAKENHDVSHPVVKFLESIGALSIGPEL